MRLPQDRLLHIDTEFKDGKVNIVAEWQGELVRCKDCIYWTECENGTGSCHRSENGHNWFGTDATDYCSFGERKEGEDK